ncbi:MAG: fumarylacetoacetate hydrolase family protein, partial [Phenylobacterium sp.]|nr:fumarylacetoacetate hydrolase family protein [Phenylobacterium sp.]
MIRDATTLLPDDADQATLVGRIWVEAKGPRVVAVRRGKLIDLGGLAPTMADLLDIPDVAGAVRAATGRELGRLADLAMSGVRMLAPCDLQAVKAAGVTFADSLLERVIEEQARGDARRAAELREHLTQALGEGWRRVAPGSPQAMRLKSVLEAEGLWSQYLEVGLGPDAEIFTKAQPMAAVGAGAEVGVRPDSAWNNPEPEVVLACNARGEVVGATLGNDVNLRDFEGRSALLLGKAKDNNASCAIGPFVRLFDDGFSLDDVRIAEVELKITGRDNFVLDGHSNMSLISRDPAVLAGQAFGKQHQYPDGFVLFLGTMFAPIQDRDTPGQGFTHKVGDRVRVSTPKLGVLENEVTTCDQAKPWTFGISALIRN